MRISIVLVSFNQCQFLEEAIRSVLNQTYQDIELILMDGGSTDGSIEILNRYREHAAYVHVGPDGGAPAALNAGLEKATGDIFAYLNSDDVLLPNAAQRWAEEFAKSKSDIVYSDIRIIDAEGRPSHLPGKRVSTFKVTPFHLRRMAAGGCTIPQQGAAWKRSVHERVGGFVEENRSSWDGEYFVDAAVAGCSFQHIPEVLGLFRVHGESISGTGKHAEQRARDHARMREKWLAAGFRLSNIEKKLWVRLGQLMRAWRYMAER